MVEIEINHEVSLLRKEVERDWEGRPPGRLALRLGQHTWHFMANHEPELTRQLPDDLDPFNADTRLDEFWEWVETNWHRRVELIREEES